jgi:uncharacterized integral membrane protein (TIGR00698 family)
MSRVIKGLRAVSPGVMLAVIIAIASFFIAENLGGPLMVFALLIGTAFNFLSTEERCEPGILFSSQVILRVGIVFLGAAVTLDEIGTLGADTIVLVVALVIATIGIGWAIGRACGLSSVHAFISAGAVAICGASAALAIASVLPRSKAGEQSLLVTIAGVTALSTLAMIIYPVVTRVFGLDDVIAGIFLGATIHDVAQVTGAGFIISDAAGETAVVVKLMRVLMLAPVVVIIGLMHRSSMTVKQSPIPLFVIGFIVMVGLNSLGVFSDPVRELMLQGARFSLVMAVAALGVRTNLKSLAAAGWGPAIALIAQSALIAVLALAGLHLFF